jgi:hypothetical protein
VKLLVCGTRKKGYKDIVFRELDKLLTNDNYIKPIDIIEGCCPDSADEYAEAWGQQADSKIYHFPSTSGNYLQRNIEMVELCDEVLCFWDNFSYGSCHTIATAVRLGKPVKIIDISRGGLNG